MRKKMEKILVWLLVLTMTTALFGSTAVLAEADSGQNKCKDYVLVLDCSGTMKTTDPFQLCASACKQFIDQVPIENARISIVAFGYADQNAYYLEGIRNPEMLKYVHCVTPLAPTQTVKNMDRLKDDIDTVTGKRGSATPVGTAMLAAMDILERGGATDGNACAILITDGDIATPHSNYSFDEDNLNQAIEQARSRDWKLFSIQMNAGKEYPDNHAITKLMRSLPERTGASMEYGHVNVTNFSEGSLDISVAIAQIISFMSGNRGEHYDYQRMELPADQVIPIEGLISEFNVTVLGNAIKSITLTYPSGASKTFNSPLNENALLVSWANNNKNIKLIAPEKGNYTIHVEGNDPKDKVAILFTTVYSNPTLTLTSTPEANGDTPVSKNTTFDFSLRMSYRDQAVKDAEYFQTHTAELTVKRINGDVTTFPMEPTADGYRYSLTIRDLGNGGAFDIYAKLVDENFIDNSMTSNSLRVKTENLPPVITNPALPSLRCYVKGSFDTIDLSNHMTNPDGDTLEYVLECTSDRNLVPVFDIKNDYLTIQNTLTPGSYTMQLRLKDSEMTDYLVFDPFTLTVENQPVTLTEIEPVELWVDAFPFQEAGDMEAEIDLLPYCTDPDGMDLTFSDIRCVTGGEIISLTVAPDGRTVQLKPTAKGEAQVTFTVSDVYSEATGTFSVHVVSGKAIFWETYRGAIIAAVIVLLILLLVIIFLVKTTHVKGDYRFHVFSQDNAMGFETQYTVNIHRDIQAGRGRNVKLKGLAEELHYLPITGTTENLEDFDSYPMLSKMTLKGVTFGKGFTLVNIPDACKVTVSGIPRKRKAKMKMGNRMVIEIPKDSGVQNDMIPPSPDYDQVAMLTIVISL